MDYLHTEEINSGSVIFVRNGIIGREFDGLISTHCLPVVTVHDLDRPWDISNVVRPEILTWFAETFPQSRLETGSVAWQFSRQDGRAYILWRTDNKHATLMMRMKWS
jgi:hypothetical protein